MLESAPEWLELEQRIQVGYVIGPELDGTVRQRFYVLKQQEAVLKLEDHEYDSPEPIQQN